jgi:hypothetical protein
MVIPDHEERAACVWHKDRITNSGRSRHRACASGIASAAPAKSRLRNLRSNSTNGTMQPFEPFAAGDIRPAEDSEHRLRLGLAFHRDAVEFQHGKLVDLSVPPRGGSENDLFAHNRDVFPAGKPNNSTAMTLGEISAKWSELQSRIRADEGAIAACSSDPGACSPATRRFLSIVDMDGTAKIGFAWDGSIAQ